MKLRAVLFMVVIALLVAACGGATTDVQPAEEAEPAQENQAAEENQTAEESEPAAEAESEPAAEKPRVLLITESPIGINPYFLSAEEGLERAAEEFGLETKVVEGTNDPVANEENLRAVSREDWDLILVMTFGFTDILTELAPQHPDKTYVCIDCFVEADNVRSVDFRTHEVAFLLGAIAGQLTESGIVGQVGPIDIPFMHRWIDPWARGVEYVNPDAEVLDTLWVGDFADPATAKELALQLADQGADNINAVAAAGNPGVFEAAAERDFLTYGVDVNECPKQPGHIVENLIKRVDVSVYNSIEDFLEGEEMGGAVSYGLEEGGVDLTTFAYPDEETQCVIEEYPEVRERAGELREMIIAGEIQIPDPVVGGDYVLP